MITLDNTKFLNPVPPNTSSLFSSVLIRILRFHRFRTFDQWALYKHIAIMPSPFSILSAEWSIICGRAPWYICRKLFYSGRIKNEPIEITLQGYCWQLTIFPPCCYHRRYSIFYLPFSFNLVKLKSFFLFALFGLTNSSTFLIKSQLNTFLFCSGGLVGVIL